MSTCVSSALTKAWSSSMRLAFAAQIGQIHQVLGDGRFFHALQVRTQIHSTGDGWYITDVNGKQGAIWTGAIWTNPQLDTKLYGMSGSGMSIPWVLLLKGLPESELRQADVPDGLYVVPIEGWGIESTRGRTWVSCIHQGGSCWCFERAI